MRAFPPDYARAHLVALGVDLSRVEESFTHSSGAGGQNVNKVATCMQLRYPPRNILVKMQEHRTQASNRLAAWKLLAVQLQRAKDERERERRAARELKRRQNAPRPKGIKKQFVELKRRRAKTKQERRSLGED